MKIWYLLTEEIQEKIRKIMPEGWKPPPFDDKDITVSGQVEDIVEIDREMRKPPSRSRE